GGRPRRPDPAAASARTRQKRRRVEPLPWLKPGVFLGALVPLISIALRGSRGELGANPIARVENELGLSALVFLLAALACSPAWLPPLEAYSPAGLFGRDPGRHALHLAGEARHQSAAALRRAAGGAAGHTRGRLAPETLGIGQPGYRHARANN